MAKQLTKKQTYNGSPTLKLIYEVNQALLSFRS